MLLLPPFGEDDWINAEHYDKKKLYEKKKTEIENAAKLQKSPNI